MSIPNFLNRGLQDSRAQLLCQYLSQAIARDNALLRNKNILHVGGSTPYHNWIQYFFGFEHRHNISFIELNDTQSRNIVNKYVTLRSLFATFFTLGEPVHRVTDHNYEELTSFDCFDVGSVNLDLGYLFERIICWYHQVDDTIYLFAQF